MDNFSTLLLITYDEETNSTKTGFSPWMKGLSQSETIMPEAFQIVVFNTYRKHNPTGVLQYGRQLEILWLDLALKLAFHPVT
jgi:hypothetical protein